MAIIATLRLRASTGITISRSSAIRSTAAFIGADSDVDLSAAAALTGLDAVVAGANDDEVAVREHQSAAAAGGGDPVRAARRRDVPVGLSVQ